MLTLKSADNANEKLGKKYPNPKPLLYNLLYFVR